MDSWDVGQGAQDDGASIMAPAGGAADEEARARAAAHHARRLLGQRGEWRPGRRGVRRLRRRGDREARRRDRDGWRRRSASRLRRGRRLAGFDRRCCRQIAKLLAPLGAGEITGGGGGGDIGPLRGTGSPAWQRATVGRTTSTGTTPRPICSTRWIPRISARTSPHSR